MIRLIEATLFLGLAGALHIAALALPGITGGGSAGGDKGAASVTLQAAPKSLAAVAQRWDTPPDTADAPAQPSVENADTLPVVTLRDSTPPRPLPAPRPPQPQRAEAPPAIDTQPALPQQPEASPRDTAQDLPDPAPRTSLRPKPRAPQTAAKPPAPAKPAAKNTQTPTQRAKGSGLAASGPQRTTKAPVPTAGPSQASLQKAQAAWGAQIRQSVARAQRYPGGTSARGIVTLQISVSPSGRLAGVSLTSSSGNASLDRAALQAAQSARLPRAPKGLSAASYSFNLPLQFARR